MHAQIHLSPPHGHAHTLSTYIPRAACLDLWLIVVRSSNNKHCRVSVIHLTAVSGFSFCCVAFMFVLVLTSVQGLNGRFVSACDMFLTLGCNHAFIKHLWDTVWIFRIKVCIYRGNLFRSLLCAALKLMLHSDSG